MDQAAAIAKLVVPRIPLMLKSTYLHSVGSSPTSSKWDLKNELIATFLRSMMLNPTSTVTVQQGRMREPGRSGPLWITETVIPVPQEDDVRQTLFRIIDELKTGAETFTEPQTLPVEGEWVGFRKGVSKDAQPLDIDKQETYNRMMKDTESNATVLYFHGGAYFLMHAKHYRGLANKLAKLNKGRVFAVDYRLAPQNPFPAALLDCLIAYLSLLYPPKGSVHQPVKSEHIVFAGDSAGGNMSLVLTQAILQFNRSSSSGGPPTVRFNGENVSIPLPAGVVPLSGWADLTRSMPSIITNARYDYLPPPKHAQILPTNIDPVNANSCVAWPANPPREDIYVNGSALCHPLVSPLAAKDWRGAPPMFFLIGEEMNADEVLVVAKRCFDQNVPTKVHSFEAMPHAWFLVFQGTNEGHKTFVDAAAWIKTVTDGGKVPIGGTWVEAKTCREEVLDLKTLTDLTDEEVDRRMTEMRDKRIKHFALVKAEIYKDFNVDPVAKL